VNLLDLVLIVAALVSALVGFRHGFVIAACSLVGFLAGSWAGVRGAPLLLGEAPQVFSTAAVALAIVLAAGAVGSLTGTFLGRRVRERITWRPGRFVDSTAGALVGVSYVLAFSWAMGVAVSNAGLPAITAPVRGSAVLAAVDRVLPEDSVRVLGGFSQLLDQSGFPAVFAPFNQEYIAPVDAAALDESVTAAVRAAARSVLRVQGDAASCASIMTGTGWVYARDLVVTNAHVVAGVDEPVVVDAAGRTTLGRVVLFDPAADLAVLRVDGLDLPPIAFGGGLDAGAPATVVGYPGGGDLRLEAARVRTERVIVGPDIYGNDQVTREVYSLRTVVLPGDSGGPLVSPAGVVVGVVFAASLEDSETGYAFTAEQVTPTLERGLLAAASVPTGACA